MSSAILLSGNNYQKIALLANFMNLGMVNSSSHYRIQRGFTIPVLDNFYEEVMASTPRKYKDKEIVVAGKVLCLSVIDIQYC